MVRGRNRTVARVGPEQWLAARFGTRAVARVGPGWLHLGGMGRE